MPGGEQQTLVLERVRQWPEGLSATRRNDYAVVAAGIERIMALADAGLFYEGREACADLLFDFQPLLEARPELLQRFCVALRRCKAEQLQRRLSIALHEEAA